LEGNIGAPNLTPSVARDQIDSIKGILIFAIVLGHNPSIHGWAEPVYILLYGFHVAGFLILPFLRSPPQLSGTLLRDRAMRYLVPHYAFVALAGVLFLYFVQGTDDVARWLWNLAFALTTASSQSLKNATGLYLFWFLPALLSLTLFYSCVGHRCAARSWIVAAAITIHLVGSALTTKVKLYAPFGVMAALWVLPLGLACRVVWLRWGVPSRRVSAMLLICTRAAGAGILLGVGSGGPIRSLQIHSLQVASIRHPIGLLLQDVYAGFAFFTLLGLSPWLARTRLLPELGRWSLQIFLLHAFFYQGFLRVVHISRLGTSGPLASTTLLLVSFSAVLFASWCSARGLSMNRTVRVLLFPRRWTEWRGEGAEIGQ